MMNSIVKMQYKALTIVQRVVLLVIAFATIAAMGAEVLSMWQVMRISLADLLLMFIYLEVLEMVSIYLTTGKLPVRIPLYISIIALARYLILDMKNLDTWRMVAITFATLLIAITVLVIRFGHARFPYEKNDED